MQMKVGCGLESLAPPLGVRIPGYFQERLASGIHDPVYVKALAFRHEHDVALMLCFDVIGLQAHWVAAVREAVSEATGIHPRLIMVSATHTHTSGPTRSRWIEGHQVSEEWAQTLPAKAAAAARKAFDSIEPCRARWGRVPEDRIAFNRRYRMKNGMVMSNPGQRNPDIIEPAGPIDPDVTAVAFESQNAVIKAVLVHYSCHLDNVGGTDISADYPGYLTRRLQERLPDSPFVFYLQGSCGDINHVDVNSSIPRKGHEHARWMGETLAGDVCVALDSAEALQLDGLRMHARSVRLPADKDADPTVATVEIQAQRIGELVVVGIPAEYFVDLQLDIKERSPWPLTLVAELTNGWIGYVPTQKAFDENMRDVPSESMKGFDHRGYEVRSALSKGLKPGCGEAIANAAVEALKQLA